MQLKIYKLEGGYMGRYIFWLICGILGFLFGYWDSDFKKWQQLVITLCVMGSYICGKLA